MVHIPLYAIIPYVIVCLTFGTTYSDLFLISFLTLIASNIVRRKRIGISIVIAVFVTIAYLNCFNAYSTSNKSIYGVIGEEITLKCVVNDMPSVNGEKVRFTAKTISAECNGQSIMLGEKISIYTDTSTKTPEYGDLLEFTAKITLPSEKMNDGGFDYRSYLNSKEIHATCNTEGYKITNHGKYEKVNPLLYGINSVRNGFVEKCDSYMSKDASSFTKAFILGYKGDMSENMKSNLAKAGISHIVAVSGLHLSIIMAIINLLISRLKSKVRAYVAPILNIVCSLFISALTGFSPSVIRAALMLTISNSAALVKRDNDSIQSLSLALLIILLINPLAVHDTGLILSATATLGIIILGKRLSRHLTKIKPLFIREIIALTLSAQIFTLPVMILCFNSFSLYGTFVNVLIVPMLPYLMGLIIVFLVCPIVPVCWFLANGIWLWVSFIIKVSEFTASIPYANVCISFRKFCYISTLLFCAVWFIRKTITTTSAKKNLVFFAISCVSISLIMFQPTSKDAKITAINTGNADCTLVQLPGGRTMLIDGGENTYRDSATNIIIPYLVQNDVYRIDYAVMSKFTDDCAAGIIALAENFDVRCIIVPKYIPDKNKSTADKVIKLCEDKKIQLHMLSAGDIFHPTDGVDVTVISPRRGYAYEANDGSLVFKLTVYNKSILFTGDIGSRTRAILSEFHTDIDADILKVPNHGSHTKEDEKLIDVISPLVAYTFTDNSPYRATQRENASKVFSEKGILPLQTNVNGTIKFTIKKNGEIHIN